MNQPDAASQPDESQKTACAEMQVARTLAPEQLRQFLECRLKTLRDARWNLLQQVKTLQKDIYAYEELLADLTTD